MPMIAEAWRSHERNILLPDATEAQRRQARLAFYGGAQSLWHLIYHDRDGAAMARRLDDLAAELAEFYQEMRREAGLGDDLHGDGDGG